MRSAMNFLPLSPSAPPPAPAGLQLGEVQDRSVYEDAEIFARNLFEQCPHLTFDYHTYRELYEVLIQFLPPPDLVVTCAHPVPTLLDRISQRGRSFEQNIRAGLSRPAQLALCGMDG